MRIARKTRRLLGLGVLLAALGVTATAAEPVVDRLVQARQSGRIRVCIWPDYYGITYYNAKTRQLSGIDVDLARALGHDLGLTVEFIDSGFPTLVDNLREGRCDVAMHAVGVTPERQAKLRFTDPYLRSDIYGITTRTSQVVRDWADIDKPGRVVAVQAGTLMEVVMRAKLRQAKLDVVHPPATREQEVASGRADVFMTDYPYSRRLLANTDWARLIAPPAPFHLTDYAYAVAPEQTALLARLNEFVALVKKDGRLRTAARRYGLEPIVVTE